MCVGRLKRISGTKPTSKSGDEGVIGGTVSVLCVVDCSEAIVGTDQHIVIDYEISGYAINVVVWIGQAAFLHRSYS
jgi:hypothetical protein